MNPDIITVTVLLFGKAKEMAGVGEARVTVPRILSYSQLKQLVFQPIMASSMLAVDQSYVDGDDGRIIELKASSELAVIPPLSGG
uniref:Molybdopterin synthase sulfur carrier subunit n=1 Tax=Steinernema glaseri TaxID=37863 RepID=A0A1I8AXL0_9BILA